MIVTGESSGELYGALLASAIKRFWPDMRVFGVGGERMKQAGVEVFAGIAGAFGLAEAVASYKTVRETFKKTAEMLKTLSPDVVVLIDYPDFNFRIARLAKTYSIRVLYYVSPQVWAWRKGRIKTIAEIADRIAVILPFEEALYKDAGIPCEFVGHPILDEINSIPEEKEAVKKTLGLDSARPVLALLPGSRSSELKRLLPVMLDVVKKFKKEFPDYEIFMPLAPNIDVSRYTAYIDKLREEGVKVEKENAVLVLSVSDAAVIASGTATLQAAFLQTPMVVIYKVFPLTYFIGRLILNVKYITLVNLLLDRAVVPELIQGRANPDTVMNELRRLLSDGSYREQMLNGLRAVKELFAGKTPSVRVAQMVGEMAGLKV
jgi:lipid-A-disaccharide synthase